MEIAFFSVTASASTVFGSGGDGGEVTLDFNCAPVGCRSEQLYVSRSQDLSQALTFDRMQFRASTTLNSIKINGYIFEERGDHRTSCEFASCVADDTYVAQAFSGTANRLTGNTFQITFPQYVVNTSYVPYLAIIVDPNSPFQTLTLDLAIDGTKENGYNENRTENGFAYQLCNGSCDGFGSYIPPQFTISEYSHIYETAFTGGVVSGTSTSIQFDIDYYLDTTEFNQSNAPNKIEVATIKDGLFSSELVDVSSKIIPTYTDGPGSVVIKSGYTFGNGDYISYGTFRNLSSGDVVFPETKVEMFFTISGGVVSGTPVVNIYKADNPLVFETQSCSISNIGGCIENSLRYVFYPSQTVLDDFGGIWQTLSTLVPFGYVTSAIGALSNLNDTASSSWTFGAIPFMDAIFTPIRNALGPILWGLYGVVFYQRVRKIQF